jgi:hypothetical protein
MRGKMTEGAKRYVLTSVLRNRDFIEGLKVELSRAGLASGEANGELWVEFHDERELKKAQDILKVVNRRIYK